MSAPTVTISSLPSPLTLSTNNTATSDYVLDWQRGVCGKPKAQQ